MNDINIKQNQESQINRLAAQRFLYSRAKGIFVFRLLISLFFAVFGPVLIIYFDKIKIYIAIIIVFYTAFDFFILRKIENKHRKDGAKIQEIFDIELFGLSWNHTVVGEKPDEEKIYLYSNKYKTKKNTENLKDWYPHDIDSLDPLSAVAVCQRINVWWDVDLRKKLSWILTVFMFLLTFTIFILLSKSSENIFLFLVFLLPLYETLIDYTRSQFLTIGKIKVLKEKVDNLLEEISKKSISSAGLEKELRVIQDEIFRHRESCLFVPDWFYKIFRSSQEEQMNYSARHYVNRILNKG